MGLFSLKVNPGGIPYTFSTPPFSRLIITSASLVISEETNANVETSLRVKRGNKNANMSMVTPISKKQSSIVSSTDNNFSTLYFHVKEKKFPICILTPTKCNRTKLNLQFDNKAEINFSVMGSSAIYITGHYERRNDLSLMKNFDDNELMQEYFLSLLKDGGGNDNDDETNSELSNLQPNINELKKFYGLLKIDDFDDEDDEDYNPLIPVKKKRGRLKPTASNFLSTIKSPKPTSKKFVDDDGEDNDDADDEDDEDEPMAEELLQSFRKKKKLK